MNTRLRISFLAVSVSLLMSPVTPAADPPLGKLKQDLTGSDPHAQAVARQLLPRLGVRVAGDLLPLLSHENPAVAKAAFDILLEVGNEGSTPGREADRRQLAGQLMVLVGADRSEKDRMIGLRLLERLVPPGYEVGPIAAMLKDGNTVLRDKARTALERIATAEGCAALRAALDGAEPEFQCALLNSLGQLQDEASLEVIRRLVTDGDARVRAAAVRALAWTGDLTLLGPAGSVARTADDATRSEAWDALIRLVNAIEEKGGNWQIVVNAYMEILRTGEGIARDAALAGLGRIGDGSCVQPVLEAIKDTDIRTWMVGIDALRRMQGVDVTRQIVEAYPTQPAKTRLALIGVLGDKGDTLAIPILRAAMGAADAPTRLAALRAIGRIPVAANMEPIAAVLKSGTEDEKAAAKESLVDLADGLRAQGRKDEAGRAYVALLATGDKTLCGRVLEGIALCPTPEALEPVVGVSAEAGLKEPVTRALLAVGGKLVAGGQPDTAMRAYEKVRQLGISAETAQTMAKQMQAVGADLDLSAFLGIVTHWWVVGPFELGEQNKGWNIEYVGEPNVKLDASYPSGDRKVSWKHMVTKDPSGRVNLRAGIADRDTCIGYAYAEITVANDVDAVLRVGSDDSERIWVNGQKAFELFAPRPLQPDQDQVPVKLKVGVNTILIKIWQNNLPWEFCVRVTGPNGVPIAFTQRTK